MIAIFLEYSVDAAHRLPMVPEGHKCGEMHGHRYDIRIEITGDIDRKTGWIIDYADVKTQVDPIINALDHKVLNQVPGLDNPTCENIASWLGLMIKPHFPGLSLIEVRETARAGCVWRAQ